jgi:hypothetical protein
MIFELCTAGCEIGRFFSSIAFAARRALMLCVEAGSFLSRSFTVHVHVGVHFVGMVRVHDVEKKILLSFIAFPWQLVGSRLEHACMTGHMAVCASIRH